MTRSTLASGGVVGHCGLTSPQAPCPGQRAEALRAEDDCWLTATDLLAGGQPGARTFLERPLGDSRVPEPSWTGPYTSNGWMVLECSF